MPAKFKSGFAHILFLVLMAGLAVGVVTLSEAGKSDSRKISAAVACAVNLDSKDCKKALPKDLTVKNLPTCSDSNYAADLTWKNKGGLTVEVATDSQFANVIGSSNINGKESVNIPNNFKNLFLEAEKTYYWRIYYGILAKFVYGPSWTVSKCIPASEPPSDDSGDSPYETPSYSTPYDTPYSTPDEGGSGSDTYQTPVYYTPTYDTPVYYTPTYHTPTYTTPF